MAQKEKKEGFKFFSKRNIAAALVFFATSGAAGLWKVYLHFDQKKADKLAEEISFEKSIEVIDNIYNSMHEIIRLTTARKVLLLRVQDSGEVPVPGKDLFSSIVYEVYHNDEEPFKKKWRYQIIDQQYTRLLLHVAQKGVVNLKTKDLDPGILKTVYEASGRKQSFVYSIHQEPDYFFYMSIVFDHDNELSASEKNTMRATVQSLRNVFRERRKYISILKKG